MPLVHEGAGGPGRTPAVRRVGEPDVTTLVEVLVRAFDDDPIAHYFFRGAQRHHRGLRRFFDLQMRREYLANGEVWTTADLAGAALWSPPGRPRPGVRDLVRLLPLVGDLLGVGRDAPHVARLLADVERARPEELHWYLGVLGTDPDRQGRGVGSALLASVLGRVDQEAMPTYLETSKEENIAFYARHGFAVTGEIDAANGGPRLWLMWREPRPPAL
jgi:ribosomal protein S18 acetylase RimI-like enzyme